MIEVISCYPKALFSDISSENLLWETHISGDLYFWGIFILGEVTLESGIND